MDFENFNTHDQVKTEEKQETQQHNEAESKDNAHYQSAFNDAQQSSAQIKSKRPKKTGLIILLFLCCISLVAAAIDFFSTPKTQSLPTITKKDFSSFFSNNSLSTPVISSSPHIAVIHIEGVIQEINDTYNQEWLISLIEQLSTDTNHQGILLYINSPGGGVYESDEVYLELLDYKAITGNPIWAYFGSLAASGGYYIGCAADYIIANRNCLTGSIGVIAGQSVDFSQFLDKHGIRVSTFHAGQNKDMLGISTPVTPEQSAIMQSIADECYHQFVEIVATSRNMTYEEAQKLADGRIYTALQAKEHELVDEIARFDEACNIFEHSLGESDLDFIHYNPEGNFIFMDYFFKGIYSILSKTTGLSSATDALLMEAKERIMPDISYPAYYYGK